MRDGSEPNFSHQGTALPNMRTYQPSDSLSRCGDIATSIPCLSPCAAHIVLARKCGWYHRDPAVVNQQRYDNRKSTSLVPTLVNFKFDVVGLLLARGRRYSPVG